MAGDNAFGNSLIFDQIISNKTSYSCKKLLYTKHTLCYNLAVMEFVAKNLYTAIHMIAILLEQCP